MREDWIECFFEDLLDYVQPTKYIVESTKYSDDYKVPVLTAGKSFIKGYTNETEGIFDNLPTIIFDDFTTASQFVNFKFKVKSSAMKILVPTSNHVNMKFTYYYMQVNQVRSDTHKRYWISVYAKKNILLPSLTEQRAIVAKIEELFSSLDNGITDLKKAQEQLKTFRQAVLKKAFEGELTKEWREKQTNLPSDEELLVQIKEERQKHYEQQIEDWNKAVKTWEENGKVGKKPGKPRKSTELPELTHSELKKLPKLASSMCWTTLGNIVWSVKDGPHYSPKYSETGIPFISGGNIRPTGVDFENVKYISPELHLELSKRCKPEINDILYTKGGTTGIARVNTYNLDFNVWVHVAVLKAVDSITPFYLQHLLNSSHCYRQSQQYTHGVGNQDLGLTRMILITLPICSIKEQHQIVQEIESRLSVCDKVEESISQSLEKAKALRQSILKKAFEGKLLTKQEIADCKKEPDWEPAAVLLERIKAEKETEQGKSKKISKKKKLKA